MIRFVAPDVQGKATLWEGDSLSDPAPRAVAHEDEFLPAVWHLATSDLPHLDG